MAEILLIRHGITQGNRMGRYIGITDEPLCEEGRKHLAESIYPEVFHVYVSPMKRCLETADALYPGQAVTVVPELRECDFGAFENKNYLELSGNPEYQAWMDSGGTLPFPNGEKTPCFRSRCCTGFQRILEETFQMENARIAVIAHGGTIMSILEAYGIPRKSFYDWQIQNGRGYRLTAEASEWNAVQRVHVIGTL